MADSLPAPTERLAFRTWRDDDADLALARQLFGDPQVTGLVGGPYDDAAVRARYAMELGHQRDYGYAYWPMFLGSEFVGCCGLKPRVPARRVFELGFYVRPAWWGKGLAVEASRAVIRYAFEQLEATALFAGHHPDNEGSRRTLAKLGFRYTHHELYPPTGLEHPGYELSRP
jgi:[ribosomal protein S5]-alanine N-acetyltransferase